MATDERNRTVESLRCEHRAGGETGPRAKAVQSVEEPARQSLVIILFSLLILGGSFAYSIHGLNQLHTGIEANRLYVDSLFVLSRVLNDKIEAKEREILVLHSEKEALKRSLSRVNVDISGVRNTVFERSADQSSRLVSQVNLRGTVDPLASEDRNRELYSFALWLEMPQDIKQDIQYVEYEFNRPGQPLERRRSSNISDGFRTVYIGMSCVKNVMVTWHTYGNEISSQEFDLCRAVGW